MYMWMFDNFNWFCEGGGTEFRCLTNYRDEGHHGVALKDKLWSEAAAYTDADFHKEIEELKGISQDAYEYLAKIDPSTWLRAWFNTFSKCDLIVNNLC